jgi:hypothetical protein
MGAVNVRRRGMGNPDQPHAKLERAPDATGQRRNSPKPATCTSVMSTSPSAAGL